MWLGRLIVNIICEYLTGSSNLKKISSSLSASLLIRTFKQEDLCRLFKHYENGQNERIGSLKLSGRDDESFLDFLGLFVPVSVAFSESRFCKLILPREVWPRKTKPVVQTNKQTFFREIGRYSRTGRNIRIRSMKQMPSLCQEKKSMNGVWTNIIKLYNYN